MGGGPKAPFYIALLLVVGGLVYFAMNRSDLLAPRGTQENQPASPGTEGSDSHSWCHSYAFVSC